MNMIKRTLVSLALALGALPSASAQTLARTYTQTGDRAASPSVLSFYNPVDGKTYVLNGDPANFKIPVEGSFAVDPAPVMLRRNGADTSVTLDTATPTNNRPLPVTVLAGDSLGPVATGVGPSNSSSLRVHIGNASDVPVSVASPVTSIITNGGATPFTSTSQSGGKTSIDAAAYQAGTWNVGVTSSALPTGAATAANQTTANTSLSSIDGKLPAQVGGRVPVDGSGVTQPVSAASLPLPTGAATSAAQGTANTSLSSIDSKVGNIDGKLPALDAGRVPVDVKASALPAGAATEATLDEIRIQATRVDHGSTTAATRVAAQIGTDGAPTNQFNPLPIYNTGRNSLVKFRQNLATNSVNTTYDQVTANVGGEVNFIDVYWPGDEPLWLSVGPAAAEGVYLYVPPGGGQFPLNIGNGNRVAVRSESGTFASGWLVITMYN